MILWISNNDYTVKLHNLFHRLMAVTFTDVVVSYGKGSSRIRALDHANVTVPDGGGIYGLLGPSGCGKTTFLSACLNLVRPDEGQIRIFGSKPGQCGLGIPGSNVGELQALP
jgi:ABC-type transporter Mla maintaining outer membrane lipid asymmetry ATPase subunit MlaF